MQTNFKTPQFVLWSEISISYNIKCESFFVLQITNHLKVCKKQNKMMRIFDQNNHWKKNCTRFLSRNKWWHLVSNLLQTKDKSNCACKGSKRQLKYHCIYRKFNCVCPSMKVFSALFSATSPLKMVSLPIFRRHPGLGANIGGIAVDECDFDWLWTFGV